MRWLRLLFALINSGFKSKLTINDSSSISFRVWITDVDASIMNHAAMMTVFEAGRIDFIKRVGFFKLIRQKQWYFASGGMSVQFFRPLKVFQKAEVTTAVLHVSEQWIYTKQIITRKGKDIAICIAKSKAKKGKEDIHTDEIMTYLKEIKKPVTTNALIESYETSNILFKENLGN